MHLQVQESRLFTCAGLWHTGTDNVHIPDVSFSNKSAQGFTMGISRGPLHWDNKGVMVSERANRTVEKTSFIVLLMF